MPTESNRPTISDLASAAAYVRSVPTRYANGNGGRRWGDDIDGVALLTACLLNQADPTAACRELGHRLGVTGQTFEGFIHGHGTSGGRWQDLRDRLTAMGVRWLPDSREKTANGRASAVIDAPASSPPVAAVRPTSPEEAAATVRAMPRGDAGRIKWQDNFAECLIIVRAILSAPAPRLALDTIAARSGCRVDSLRCMAMGQTPSGRPWPRLRKLIRQCGLTPLTPMVNRPRIAAAKPAKPAKPANGKDHAPSPLPSTATILEATADAGIVVAPPRVTWGMVVGTDDIEVVEVRLLRYGTPEHRAFVRERLGTMGTTRQPNADATEAAKDRCSATAAEASDASSKTAGDGGEVVTH